MELMPVLSYSETIVGPWGPTTGSPLGERLAWSVTEAVLAGDGITARLAMPGSDWIRLGADGLRRQDQRLVFETDDGAVILLSYDDALIRPTEAFTTALAEGGETRVEDQYMRMVARFDTGAPRYRWLTESLFVGEGRVAGPHRIEYAVFRID